MWLLPCGSGNELDVLLATMKLKQLTNETPHENNAPLSLLILKKFFWYNLYVFQVYHMMISYKQA